MIKLKNRFIMAPVKLGYSDGTGIVNERHLQFYKRRNKYIGAISPEPFYMDAGLRELPTQLGHGYLLAQFLSPQVNDRKDKIVLIIGGGLIGVDIATALIPLNNHVIILKRTTDFGEDMEMIAKSLSLKIMHEKGTVFSDHTLIKKIKGNTVFAERNGKDIQFKNIDIIVVSAGMKSYNPLEKDIKSKMPVYVIGDARHPGNAQDAIGDAYQTVKNL